MKKSTSTILAYSLSLALALGCTAFGMTSAKAGEDGDIVTNPWSEIFTSGSGTSGDLELPTAGDNNSEKTTTKKSDSEETTTKKSDPEKVTTKKNNSNSENNSGTSKVTVKKVKIKKVKRLAGKKSAKVYLKKVSGAKGYKIKYSTSKKFKGKTTKTVTSKKTTKTIKKLKANKKYYFKARAYKLVNGKKKYGKWSSVKTLKKAK